MGSAFSLFIPRLTVHTPRGGHYPVPSQSTRQAFRLVRLNLALISASAP
jgi:hypothetical protein